MIYFDNAATTKPDGECLGQALKYLEEFYYNPSALYAEGYKLNKELRVWRENILNTLADGSDFTLEFTSCGTEADNHALFCGGRRGNIVTTSGEHSAVYSAVNELKQRGLEVRFANLNADGSVDTGRLLSLIDSKTSLVSVIHVNNETGAVNDIAEISKQVKSINSNALFHSDGVQAYGKIHFKLTKNIDLYSVSAHKIGAVKGCGGLFKRKSLVLRPYIFGGGQEQGARSGTENVFGIKMFELAAIKRYSELEKNFKNAQEVKNTLIKELDSELFSVISSENSSPYILTVIADGVRGETILHEADDRGLIIGTGSACSSNDKNRYSRTVLACGIDKNRADGVLRLSFSPENTMTEAVKAAEILNGIVKNRKNIMA